MPEPDTQQVFPAFEDSGDRWAGGGEVALPLTGCQVVASDLVHGGVCCEAPGAAVGAEPEIMVVVTQMVGGGAWVEADAADRIGGVLRRR